MWAYSGSYGWMEIESDEDMEFYNETVKNSVEKECKNCGELVLLRRDYSSCNSCMERLERMGGY